MAASAFNLGGGKLKLITTDIQTASYGAYATNTFTYTVSQYCKFAVVVVCGEGSQKQNDNIHCYLNDVEQSTIFDDDAGIVRDTCAYAFNVKQGDVIKTTTKNPDGYGSRHGSLYVSLYK